MAISFSGTPQNPKTVAIAEGRFDQKKMEAYSAQFGNLKTASGKTIYAVTLSNPARTAYFTFLGTERVEICNDATCFFQSTGEKPQRRRRLARAFHPSGGNAAVWSDAARFALAFSNLRNKAQAGGALRNWQRC